MGIYIDMKKKVLIMTSWYPLESTEDPNYRSCGNFVADQARALAMEYDVAVLHVDSWYNPEKILLERDKAITIFHHMNYIPSSVIWGDLNYHRSCLITFFREIKILSELWGIPDLIHAHVVAPVGWAGLLIGRLFRIPVILTEHSAPFQMHLNTSEKILLVRSILKGVDRVIAVSPYLADQIRAVEPDLSIDVLGNVVNPEFFKDGDSTWQKETSPSIIRFLTVGISPLNRKGIPTLLKATQMLKSGGEERFEILIGGGGTSLPELTKLAAHLGIKDRCRFLGGLSREETRRWMHASDVFVLPSLTETFSVVTAEALACGKPVIITRCGGPEYFVNEENGIQVAVDDPSDMANAMRDYIQGKYKFNSQNIRQGITNLFAPEAYLRNASTIYNQVWESRLFSNSTMYDSCNNNSVVLVSLFNTDDEILLRYQVKWNRILFFLSATILLLVVISIIILYFK